MEADLVAERMDLQYNKRWVLCPSTLSLSHVIVKSWNGTMEVEAIYCSEVSLTTFLVTIYTLPKTKFIRFKWLFFKCYYLKTH